LAGPWRPWIPNFTDGDPVIFQQAGALAIYGLVSGKLAIVPLAQIGIPAFQATSPKRRDPLMSARLLSVLILPTLLLTIALTPVGAAQQATKANKPAKHGKSGKPELVSKVYQVMDLVVPAAPVCLGSSPAKDSSWNAKTPPGAPSVVEMYMAACGKPIKRSGCPKGDSATREKELIALIKTTIQPTSWDDQGGPCTIEYWPLTGALVVNAPPDMQEQIEDQLAAMRRLYAAEAAVELRFLAVADCVYDRLRTDFELQDAKYSPLASLDDARVGELFKVAQSDQGTHLMQAPKITMFNGQPATIRVLDEKRFSTGLTLRWTGDYLAPVPQQETISLGLQIGLQPMISADHKSVHLNLDIKQTSLESTQPPLIPTRFFSTVDPSSGQRMGLMQIYPATTKTNTTQITDKDLPRLFLSDKDMKKLDKPETVIFTQFIQAPKINKVSLERKLTVPDGKTAILYGWKETVEVSDPVPVLSKLPVVGKLYQHLRREPATVLVLVTPRVIVQQEEQPEVLPMPRPLHAQKAIKRTGGAEEQEAPPSVEELLAKYHKACAAGRLTLARKLAIRALAIDPTCFDKQR
jgi:hypothetical protein